MNQATRSGSDLTARREVVRRLRRIEKDAAFAGLIETDVQLDAQDARFVTDLVSGVTRWRRWLDFLIGKFYHGDAERLELDVRLILRIGVYELLIREAPAHAAVNEAAELAKQRVRRGAAGLVNAILRSVIRSRDNLPQPETGDPALDLAVRHSHPTWMVRRWLMRYGPEDTTRLLEYNNSRPVYGLRVNPEKALMDALLRRMVELDVDWDVSLYDENFVRVRSLQPVFRGGLVRDGWCVVQDEGAGLVVRLTDPKPDEFVVDACAAPGGKALYMASLMESSGEVAAVDVNEARVGLVRETARRLGIGNVTTRTGDARQLSDVINGRTADRVLLDAPCSGLGVLDKRADLRWRRQESDMAGLISLQAELLDSCADAVRPGGLLVYSSCSIEPDENEDQVEHFLHRRRDFKLESPNSFIPDELISGDYYRTLPHEHHVDGAFGARLRRRT